MDNIYKIEEKKEIYLCLKIKSIAVSVKSPVKNLCHYFTIGKEKPIIPTYPPISAFFSNPAFTKSLPKEEMKEDLLVNSPAPFPTSPISLSHKCNTFK